MGININCLKALSLIEKRQSFSGKSLLTLGRQNVGFRPRDLRKLFSVHNKNVSGNSDSIADKEFADSLFQALGFSSIDSMDYSAFEGAQIVHDLNKPIDAKYHNAYDVVLDGGTLEHVFNFPVAIESCMQLVKRDGYLIIVTPANNLLGHGFYQFGPELFYRLFTKENGFEVVEAFVNGRNDGTWYSVIDPVIVKERVVLINDYATELVIVAKKIQTINTITLAPQQSDYQTLWDDFQHGVTVRETSYFKKQYQKHVPKKVRDFIWRYRHVTILPNLGRHYKGHFKRLK